MLAKAEDPKPPTASRAQATSTSHSTWALTLKRDPKRMTWVAPEEEESRETRYKNSAESPVAAPRTTPVATSR